MKIAFFVDEFPVISETFILNQIVGMLQRGHDVEIFARAPSGLNERHSDAERFDLGRRVWFHSMPERKITRLRSGIGRLIRWGWRRPTISLDSLNILRHGRAALNLNMLHDVIPALRKPRSFDVIHCQYGPNGRLALAWREYGALLGPLITTFHGYDVNRLPRIEGVDLYGALFRKGELFTVGSEFMRQRVIALGAPKDRVVKLPMGVRLSQFHITDQSKFSDDELRLLTVARLVEVKGIEYAIRAVASLKHKYPGIRYEIVGDGPLRRNLEGLTNFLGLAENVMFLGALPHEDVIERYQRAQLFLLPSIVTPSGEEEAQSLALAEAQASGLPVIATRVGGIPESIWENNSGLLVPPQDPDALACAIDYLALHRERWTAMGRAGHAHVKAKFDLDRLNDQLSELYSRLAIHR